MNLLDAMRYLSALAQARHFGRAAEACHITQPALSNAIRALEQEFGVTIVRRGRQYEGLTPEGERVLASAHRMLHEREALRQELGQARAAPGGPLLLACVPTALPVAARLVARLRAAHPALRPTLRSLSSPEIETGLEELSIDLALGYAERIEARGVRARVAASYRERHVLLRRRDPSARGRVRRVAPLRWREAAALPLGLRAQQLVVGVEEPQVLAAGSADHGVARRAQPLVARMVHQGQAAGPARGQRVHEGARAVGGRVVEHPHLHARAAVRQLRQLLHHRPDALGQVVLHVVDGHEDAEPGSVRILHRGCSSPRSSRSSYRAVMVCRP